MESLFRDLLVGIVAGVLSGGLVFFLLSRRVPRVKIMGVFQSDDRIRITVKNTRPTPWLLPTSACSVVENRGELHVVISVRSEDPRYSQRLPFIRNDPMIIQPEATFVFVTKDSIESIKTRAMRVEKRWKDSGLNVDNMGIRFGLLSRDGFSNVPRVFEKTWDLIDLTGGTMNMRP